MDRLTVRPLETADLAWAGTVLAECGSGRVRARRGELVDVLGLPGLVAELEGEPAGFLTFRLTPEECEITALGVVHGRRGVGTALVQRLLDVASACTRVWVITTNDDLSGLRFYQRRGFVLAALWPRAAEVACERLGLPVPAAGTDGIARRDEVELELVRQPRR